MSLPLRLFWIRAHRWVGVMLAPVLLVIVLCGTALSFAPTVSTVGLGDHAAPGALAFAFAIALFGVTTTGVWSWARGESVVVGAPILAPSDRRRDALEAFSARKFRLVGRRRLDEPIGDDAWETWSIALEAEDELDFHPGDVLRISPSDGGRERQYSIGSSSLVDPRLLVLTLCLHRFTDADGGRGFGRLSGELIRETPLGGLVFGSLQPQSEFRPPRDPTQPIVMIAAGSGIGPFPGFLDERYASGRPGRAWLFFGNRHRDGDFLWQERFQAALLDGSLTRLDAAFSRDEDDGAYVQDRLWEHARELRRWLIDDGALVYISGRREMVREVEIAIAAIVADGVAPAFAQDRIRVEAFD